MSFMVATSYGGNVVILSLNDGVRFDLSVDLAVAAVNKLKAQLENQDTSHTFAVIDALDDRSFRFAGKREDAEYFVEQLSEAIASLKEPA